MKEYFEFRFSADDAKRLLPVDCGTRLKDVFGDDSVRKVIASPGSDHFKLVESLARKKRSTSPFCSWDVKRVYTPSELDSATLFALRIERTFEPVGEECGTIYDPSTACKYCGGGIQLMSDLVLDLRRISKRADIARSLADEWVVSQRLAEIVLEERVTGCTLHPVRHKNNFSDATMDYTKVPAGRQLLESARRLGLDTWQTTIWMGEAEQRLLTNEAIKQSRERLKLKSQRWNPPPPWYRLEITSSPLKIEEPTQLGIEPFLPDTKGKYICRYAGKLDHTIGLNILSELHVANTWDESDICRSSQLVGLQMGVLRPAPVLIISQRLRRILEKYKIKGYSLEVAYLH